MIQIQSVANVIKYRIVDREVIFIDGEVKAAPLCPKNTNKYDTVYTVKCYTISKVSDDVYDPNSDIIANLDRIYRGCEIFYWQKKLWLKLRPVVGTLPFTIVEKSAIDASIKIQSSTTTKN